PRGNALFWGVAIGLGAVAVVLFVTAWLFTSGPRNGNRCPGAGALPAVSSPGRLRRVLLGPPRRASPAPGERTTERPRPLRSSPPRGTRRRDHVPASLRHPRRPRRPAPAGLRRRAGQVPARRHHRRPPPRRPFGAGRPRRDRAVDGVDLPLRLAVLRHAGRERRRLQEVLDGQAPAHEDGPVRPPVP